MKRSYTKKRVKKETIVYFVILAVFVLLYLLMGKPAFLIAAAIMAVYLLLALFLLAFSGKKMEVSVSAISQTKKEEPQEVQVVVQNQSAFPVLRCDVFLEIANLLTSAKVQEGITLGLLPKQARKESLQCGDAHTGILQIRVSKLRIADPLLLFSKTVVWKEAEAEMLILPELTDLELSSEEIEHYDMESFQYADGRVGTDSSETVGIREYEPGDNVKAIHWKLSAKTGTTQIREFGFPVDAKILILADKRLPDEAGSARKSKTGRAQDAEKNKREICAERLTELALSLSAVLIKQEKPHSFGWYDETKDGFICEEITREEDLYALLAGFLRVPVSQTAESAVSGFLSSEYEKKYAGYFYVTDHVEEDRELELLRGFADVTVFTTERIQSNQGMGC